MSKQWIPSLMAGAILASAAGVVAAEEEKGFYLGGNAFYTDVFDADGELTTSAATTGNDPVGGLLGGVGALPGGGTSDVETEYDADGAFGISLGYKFASAWRAELEYRDGENEVENGNGDLSVEQLLVNFWYDFNQGERLRPYLGFGIGMADMEVNGASDDVTIGQLGAGLNYHLTPRVVLDAGYRYAMSEDPTFKSDTSRLETEYEAQSLLLGLRFNFFDAQYGPKDADGDGVFDNADQCPGTPRGVQVDSVGCPLDGDKDGVADYLDKCPNTPAGEEVDEQGCSLDSDGDGVVNRNDACPDTAPGTPVMSNGCGQEQSVVLRGVNFEFNSAQLTVNAETILDGVAATLISSPGFDVELQGHTDSKGSDSYNMNLSQNRAKSVKRYLTVKGVEGSRLTARGYGEEQPVASNDTAEGRAQNRRVELKVLGSTDVPVDNSYLPAVEAPMADEPMLDEPMTEEPMTEEPAAEESYEYEPAAVEESSSAEEDEYEYEYEP
ncbi:MAG: OmpA family protein [Spongiibacter sp.]|nr:OmpA family protein [Spongiibacter sp.]